MWYSIVVVVLMAYLLGNINGSVCISTLTHHEDVRTHGSGNAGLTNFFRSYGGGATLLVMAADCGKTVVACLAGELILAPFGQEKLGMVIAAVAVSLGHDFPALLGFRGGKGILCGISALFVIDWHIALAVLAVFLLAYGLTKYVYLGSILGAVTYAVGFLVVYRQDLPVMLGGVFLGLLAIYMHRGNIRRLLRGEESKVYLFRKGGKK